MSANRTEHVTFWRALADGVERGLPLVDALASAGQAAAGRLDRAAQALVASLNRGRKLSEAMAEQPELFSPAQLAVMGAGEAGGTLDVAARSVAEGLAEGSLSPPLCPAEGADPAASFWGALWRMLSAGVPVLEALGLAGQAAGEPRVAQAARSLASAVRGGSTLADAMRGLGEMFPERLCAAVDEGERAGTLDAMAERIASALRRGDLSSLPEAPPAGAGEAEPLRAVNRIIREAIRRRASDIHLQPVEGGTGQVRLRVDGVLQPTETVPPELFRAVVGRFKIMAGMDVPEKMLPQDGRIVLQIDGEPYDLRVSCLPVMFGERVVARILSRQAVRLDLGQLGLLEDDLEKIRRLARLPSGVVACTGPTGSGKTTLLYSVLGELNVPGVNLMSVEDPVEYVIPGVAQTQVNAGKGLTFARAVRAMLRQDPDVLLIGEIRDFETLMVAVQSALTGHLVLTTLHTNDAPSAISRLLDMGLEPFLVTSALAGVVSMRLARLLCGACKKPAPPDPTVLPPEAAEIVRRAGRAEFCVPAGCSACRGTGYRGRTGLYEILVMDDRVRAAVAAGGPREAVRDAALAGGMRTLLADGLAKAARGLTSIQEVLRVAAMR